MMWDGEGAWKGRRGLGRGKGEGLRRVIGGMMGGEGKSEERKT